MLDIVDSNNFNHKNKIGEFKYNEIKDLANNIENNTISETDAKKKLNTLNKIKNTELKKYKIRTPSQKKLLNLFDDLLKTVLINNDNDNDNVNENNNDNDYDNNDNENNNDNDNENDNDDNVNDNDNDNDNENENENENKNKYEKKNDIDNMKKIYK